MLISPVPAELPSLAVGGRIGAVSAGTAFDVAVVVDSTAWPSTSSPPWFGATSLTSLAPGVIAEVWRFSTEWSPFTSIAIHA